LSNRPKESVVDVLSDVLGTLRLHSTIFAHTEIPAPWGVRARGDDRWAFHLILRGTCWLEVDGLAPRQVSGGDVILLPRGQSHVLRDSRKTKPIPLEDLFASGMLDARPANGAATTQLVCGCFGFEDARAELLVSALPPLVHVKNLAEDLGPWLAHTVKLVSFETSGERPGGAIVVNRLCDALFVYVLRSALAELPEGRASWLRGVVDPQIGVALRVMHEAPEKAWTVGTLAAKVAMSRSAFAARFTSLVGETPMQYLTRWRVQKAASMLRASAHGIAQVAANVGYESEAAFNKAFKRSIGVAPGAYRRAARISP
jgi:AraC-like DNA-binding protein